MAVMLTTAHLPHTRWSPTVLALVATASLGVAAERPINWSENRERWNAVDSPYLDLRRTIGGVNPGAAIPGSGIELTLRGVTVPKLYNRDDRTILTTTGQEDRQYGVYGQVRQMEILGPLGWEVKAGYAGSAVTGPHGDPTDPLLGVNWAIASQRRWGITLFGGIGLPAAHTTNWADNHGGPSYRGELRASAALGMLVVTADVGATRAQGRNDDARGIPLPTTPPSTASSWDTAFLGVDARILATWRVTRWFRFGVLQEVTRLHWDGTAPFVEVQQTTLTAPTSAVAEWNLTHAWHGSLTVGRDFITTPRPDGIQAELGITRTFYP